MTVIQLFNGSRFIGKGRGNGVVRVCDTFGIDWEQKRGNKTCKITRVVLVVLEKRDFVFFLFWTRNWHAQKGHGQRCGERREYIRTMNRCIAVKVVGLFFLLFGLFGTHYLVGENVLFRFFVFRFGGKMDRSI